MFYLQFIYESLYILYMYIYSNIYIFKEIKEFPKGCAADI